jgi:large subunit ribosomal protein L29
VGIKAMRAEELRNMTYEELKQKEFQLNEELFNLKIRYSLGQLENPLKIRTARKDVARAKTILREKETKPSS